MRVISRKLKCLSACFSKSSIISLHSPCPLTLGDAQPKQYVSNQSTVSHALEEQSTEEKTDGADEIGSCDMKVEDLPKSSLKKSPLSGSGDVTKGRVKWMDLAGKELVEIREFEPIDSGESEDVESGNQACMCVIQ